MNSFYYAAASIRHHKKKMIIYSAVFFIFLLITQFIFLLNEAAQQLYLQLNQLMENNQLSKNPISTSLVGKIELVYRNEWILVSMIYLVIMSVFLVYFLFSKRTELIHWRLSGTSSRRVWSSLLMELVLPAFIITVVLSFIMIAFQSFFVDVIQQLNGRTLDLFSIQANNGIQTTIISGDDTLINTTSGNLLTVDFTNISWSTSVLISSAQAFVSLMLPFLIIYTVFLYFFLKYLPRYVR